MGSKARNAIKERWDATVPITWRLRDVKLKRSVCKAVGYGGIGQVFLKSQFPEHQNITEVTSRPWKG